MVEVVHPNGRMALQEQREELLSPLGLIFGFGRTRDVSPECWQQHAVDELALPDTGRRAARQMQPGRTGNEISGEREQHEPDRMGERCLLVIEDEVTEHLLDDLEGLAD